MKSEIPFTLKTTGDCNGSVLPPSFIKQVDGKWQELYGVRQLCCGLPCTMDAIHEMQSQIKIEIAGVYKMIVHTCGETVSSNTFEVIE